ncbi:MULTISPECIES: hypothetical protein [Sphingomonas]
MGKDREQRLCVPRREDRRVISGIADVLQAGYRWKDASGLYVTRQTL